MTTDNASPLDKAFEEGCEANDHNRRVIRKQLGERKDNPYKAGSESWKAWNAGYQYRDMVNDG